MCDTEAALLKSSTDRCNILTTSRSNYLIQLQPFLNLLLVTYKSVTIMILNRKLLLFSLNQFFHISIYAFSSDIHDKKVFVTK